MFRNGETLPPPWEDLFGPLGHGSVDDLVVVGQSGSRSMPASPPRPGTPTTSMGRPGLPICIDCGRWLTPS